jgi:hypothetical protein
LKTKNLIVLSLLATLLVSSTFVSFAQADDDDAGSVSVSPDTSSEPTITPKPSDDNSTVTSGDEILYTAQNDNATGAADDTQVPGAEDANLLSASKSAEDDNTCLILALVTVLAIGIGGAVGVVYYRKQNVKAKN